MEAWKEKNKKSILKKTWERCKSFGNVNIAQTTQRIPYSPSTTPMSSPSRPIVKSKSWSTLCPPSPSTPRSDKKRVGFMKPGGGQVAVPNGCFTVYVGPDKQRFVIKVKYTSHPLFKMLLEEAELEYGYHSDGPLVLPCEVEVFIKVLFEMDVDDHDDNISQKKRCGFPKSKSSYHLLSSPRLVSLNQL